MTAVEMKVQRGYGHDGEAARKQSKYIDDLLCDVVAMAFRDWLKVAELSWVLELDAKTPKPDLCKCQLDELPCSATIDTPTDWEAALYLFLHLVPVEESGRLLHQLNKWEILSNLGNDELNDEDVNRLEKLRRTITLNLDMHDAKFEGGEALIGCEEFSDLFDNEQTFSRLFPTQVETSREVRIPKRGLREIMRYGNRHLINSGFTSNSICAAEVDEYLEFENGDDPESIQAAQKEREEIHEQWQQAKRKSNASLSAEQKRAYVEALQKISRHRHLSTRLHLNDHVELHKVLMKVLGRLVDYSAIFERDIYFVTLALMDIHRLRPEEVFKGPSNETGSGLHSMSTGQIFAAFNKLTTDGKLIRDDVEALFGENRCGISLFDGNGSLRVIRNGFAHFNCLHSDRTNPPNLTKLVNDARRLMSYDRKLRNSVTKSIRELLAREGYLLNWQMSNHELSDAKVSSKSAIHLGGMKVHRSQKKPLKINENLRGDTAVSALAKLFGGESSEQEDVTAWNLEEFDWDATSKKREQTHENAPRGSKKTKRKRRRNVHKQSPTR